MAEPLLLWQDYTYCISDVASFFPDLTPWCLVFSFKGHIFSQWNKQSRR